MKPKLSYFEKSKKTYENKSLIKEAKIDQENKIKKEERSYFKTPNSKKSLLKKRTDEVYDVSIADTARKMKRYQTRLDNFIKSTKRKQNR